VAIVVAAPWSRRTVRPMAAALGGLLVPVALAALHGALTGWQRWLYAVAGYRFGQRSALTGANWGRLGRTYSVVAPVLVPTLLVVVCLLAIVVVHRPVLRRAVLVLTAWGASSILAFLLGGQFHRHYWVIVMFPLGTAAGALLSVIRPRVVRMALLAALLVVPLTMTWRVARMPRDEVTMKTSADPRLVKDEQVAAWFDEQADSGDQLYVLCYSAGVYGNTDVDPPYPYLWADNVTQIDVAIDEMVEMLASPAPPTFVADYQRAAGCDPTGRVGELLGARYRRAATVAGIPILEWTGSGAPSGATRADGDEEVSRPLR
jgi:hypothetical protein